MPPMKPRPPAPLAREFHVSRAARDRYQFDEALFGLSGNVVFANVGIANNVPFAAAFAMVPLAIMAVFLAIMKRLGAFESL